MKNDWDNVQDKTDFREVVSAFRAIFPSGYLLTSKRGYREAEHYFSQPCGVKGVRADESAN